jgi:hypothetical protein
MFGPESRSERDTGRNSETGGYPFGESERKIYATGPHFSFRDDAERAGPPFRFCEAPPNAVGPSTSKAPTIYLCKAKLPGPSVLKTLFLLALPRALRPEFIWCPPLQKCGDVFFLRKKLFPR